MESDKLGRALASLYPEENDMVVASSRAKGECGEEIHAPQPSLLSKEAIGKEKSTTDKVEYITISTTTLQPNDLSCSKETTNGPCGYCGKQTTSFCEICSDYALSEKLVTKAWYCGFECQKAGLAHHATLCYHVGLRKKLIRAGKLLRQVFFTAREHAFDLYYSKATPRGGKIELHRKTPNKLFGKIPNRETWTQPQLEALLSNYACLESVLLTHSLIPKLLDGKHYVSPAFAFFVFSFI